VRIDLGFFMPSMGRFATSVAGLVMGGGAPLLGFEGMALEVGIFLVFICETPML
jgi:hypothetical protein